MAGAPSAAPAQIMRKTPRRSQSAMLFRWLLYRRSISPLIRADPLDCAEWADLCNDDEALAMDCAFAAGFGLLGYILRRLNWPLVPIVLGMVLGSIMIEKLTAGAGKVKFWLDLINRPVSGTLAFIILLVILGSLFSYIFNKYKKYY